MRVRTTKWWVVAAIGAGFATSAMADSPAPPGLVQRVADADGERYVAMDTMGAWIYAQRAPAAGPIRSHHYGEGNTDGVLPADPTDRVLARGSTGWPSPRVIVADERRGFVFLYGRRGLDLAATSYEGQGKLVARRTLSELYEPHEVEAFARRSSVSTLYWLRTAWFDAAGAWLLTVDWDGRARALAWPALVPRDLALADAVVEALAHADAEVRAAGLDLATQYVLEETRPALRRIADDADAPATERFRAFLALLRLGGPGGTDKSALRDAIVGRGTASPEDRERAVALAREILGDEAIPLLVRHLGVQGPLQWAATEELAEFGPKAFPHVLPLVSDAGRPPAVRANALDVIWRWKDAAADDLPTRGSGPIEGADRQAWTYVRAALRDPDPGVVKAAIRAAQRIGGDEVTDTFLAMLAKGSADTQFVSSWFWEVRHARAEEALRAALARLGPNDDARTSIEMALAFQRGEDPFAGLGRAPPPPPPPPRPR